MNSKSIEVYFKENTYVVRVVASILSAVSCVLLILFPTSAIVSVFAVLASSLLFLYPSTIIPVVFTASISSSISLFGFSALFYYAFIFFLSSIVLAKNFKLYVPKKKYFVFLVILLSWMVYCSLRSASGNLYDTLKLCFTIALLVGCALLCNCSWKQVIKELDTMAIICSPIILFKLLFIPSKFVIEGVYDIKILNTVSESLNPNQLAIAMAVLAVIELFFCIKTRKLHHICTFVTLFIILVLLKSRTSFFSTMFVCGLYFISECKISRRLKTIILITAILLSTTIIAIDIFHNRESSVSSEAGKEMNMSSIIQSGGNGRFLTWAVAFSEIIPYNLISGIGVGVANYEAWGYVRDADNLYVDLMAEIGVPGFILFFLFYSSLIIEIKKKVALFHSKNKVFEFIMMLMLLCGIGETLFDSSMLWVIIILCIFFVQSHKNSKVVN